MPQNAKPELSSSSCPITRSPRLRSAKDSQTAAIESNFPPGIGKPALRALVSAGLSHLEQLSEWTEQDLHELHGIGPNAIAKLRIGLDNTGLSFSRE